MEYEPAWYHRGLKGYKTNARGKEVSDAKATTYSPEVDLAIHITGCSGKFCKATLFGSRTQFKFGKY